ncbi:type I polyketide synthase [Streptomyces sp. DH37]|uniref:type I polyketide synthase n=1 Tax=Streptomyces sp. DH37 TaxID=3040122 RepID=UPI0024420549|nr:beta-ketoacyl synthase N-terminal-like domain-containing protein [Streptomyces sp. DH37]MDG9703218.1 beta-ketoacyl synthase N-terminal-like domain-containing protein [Streptomyces sp. DH37]
MSARDEPVAVIGVGFRFPGGNDTVDGFDEFLRNGGSGIRPLPRDRWDVDAFTSEDADAPGTIRTAAGGFLERIDEFDPQFFGIAPKQAHYVDPQQRLLLETAWEALENACVDPTAVRDGGVYVGATPLDQAMELDSVPYEKLDGALATGMGAYPLSGRLSYFLRWRGPSLTTDTACASSLTALHMAVEGLRNGECGIALCGGVNALHHPKIFAILSRNQMLAPDGRCKAFDEAADGYARAEGCGVLVLKRLSDARRDGDTVLALVRSTAIGHNGESAGLTAPNGTAQEAVMRRALERAGLEPGDIQYVEAHGTGTPLGDPIEMGSINGVFGDAHRDGDPLTVGSVKSNLGHMEPAAGLGGIVKVILQMRAGVFYPHLYEQPSGRIPWDRYPVTVPTECRPWKAPVRRAMVNSFGVAGAIGIAVVEEAPAQPAPAGAPESARDAGPPGPGGGLHVFTLSAKSREALGLQVERHRRYLAERPGTDMADLCLTRNVGRVHFNHRMAAVVRDGSELAAALERQAAAPAEGGRSPGGLRKAAFLFTGSGSQYVGMGSALYRRFPVFRSHVDACDELFARHLGRSVRDIMLGTAPDAEARLAETVYTHAALFTLEYSLARLWQSWGVRPTALIGHSVGEVVAAAVAGLFTLEDGVFFLAERARLIQSVTTPGGMAAVSAPAAEVEPLLAGLDDVSICAVNSPRQCVVSGGAGSLAEVTEALRRRDVTVTPLRVSSAFHSPLMDGILEPLRAALADVEFHEPAVTLISCLSGAVAAPGEMATADYWVRHVREAVDFEGGMRALAARGRHVFLEVGPSSALGSLGRRCVPDGRHLWLSSLRSGDGEGRAVLQALADAYRAGLAISWPAVHEGGPGRMIPLPTYAFDRRRYWLPDQVGRHGLGAAATAHPLLGTEVRGGERDGGVREFVTRLGPGSTAYLADHTVRGRPFVPAAAYAEAVLALMDAVHGDTRRPIEDLRFHEALFLTGAPVEVRTSCRPIGDGRSSVEIVSRTPGRDGPVERRHVTAVIGASDGRGPALGDSGRRVLDRSAAPGEPDRELDGEEVRAAYAAAGLEYGPHFSRVDRVVRYGPDFTLSELDGREVSPAEHMPPPLFDAVTHGLAALADSRETGETYMSVGIASVRAFRKPRAPRLRAALRLERGGDGPAFTVDALLLEGDEPVLEISGMAFKRLAAAPAPPPSAPASPAASPSSAPSGGRGPAPTEAFVRSAVARLLSIDDPESVGPDTPFLDLGMDSLVATELRSLLEAELGVSLAASAVFDHPSVEQLVEFLEERTAKEET